MKTIAILIATLVATAAFAAEPAKTATPAAPAKCDPAKDKTCKVEAKKAVVEAARISRRPIISKGFGYMSSHYTNDLSDIELKLITQWPIGYSFILSKIIQNNFLSFLPFLSIIFF